MFKLTAENKVLLLMALKSAFECAYAAPMPRFKMPGMGFSPAKAPTSPAPAFPRTVDDNGIPISFWDYSDDIVDAGKGAGEKTAQVAKGGAGAAGAAGVIGGGVGAGVAAGQSEGAGMGYDYAS